MRRIHWSTLSLSALTLLASCGGGGGGGGAAGAAGPPDLRIQFPPQASLTDAEGITVRGSVARPGSVAGVSVAGIPASTTDNWKTWTVEVPLDLGDNELEARMTGPGGAELGDTEAVSVHREDVVLGDCTSFAVAEPGEQTAWWLDADRSRLIEIDTVSGERSSTPIVNSQWDFWPAESLEEMVYDTNRRQVYVVDGQRIHRVRVDGGTRSRVCSRPDNDFGWVIDLDYDPVTDRLISLETNGLFGSANREVFSIDPDTGQRSLICAYLPGNQAGDIAAHCVSILGDVAFVGSQNEMAMVDLNQGARLLVLNGLQDLRDMCSANGGIYFLEPEEGIFQAINFGLYAQVLDFDDPALQHLQLGGGHSLQGGPSLESLTFTSSSLDAAFTLDMITGEVTTLCQSAIGAGMTLAEAAGPIAFAGKELVLDPEQGRILELQPSGDRTIFTLGNHVQQPEAAVVIDGSLYVGNADTGTIIRVDAQGAQELVIPSRPELTQLRDLVYSAPSAGGDGHLYALTRKRLVRVDLDTATTDVVTSTGDGRGVDFFDAEELVMGPAPGTAFFTAARSSSSSEGQVFLVLLDLGSRVLVAGEDSDLGSFGSGADVSVPRGLAQGAGSNELVVAAGPRGLGTMSLYTLSIGQLFREELSSKDRGRGPLLDMPGTIRRHAASGNYYVSGRTEGAVLVVDPGSGDRVMTSR